jgi:hypothetical protein
MKQEKRMRPCYESVEAEVTETMGLLDRVEHLEVHRLFRVRLMQRLEEELVQRGGGRVSTRLDVGMAFVVLLLLINLASALLVIKPEESRSAGAVGQLADNQSDDYSGHEFAYYDQTASYAPEKP